MANFMEFIRYGLPGYIFVTSLVYAVWIRGGLPGDSAFYNNFGTIIGAGLLVVGPLVGFIIHQLYFVYFDFEESYTQLSRGCLKTLFDFHKATDAAKYTQKAAGKTLRKSCYVAWKLLMTGMDETFKVSPVFLSRLTSLRNYSHSFGGIILSSLLSIAGFIVIAQRQVPIISKRTIWFYILHLLLILLFVFKRREIGARIHELETGIMKLRIVEFSGFITTLTSTAEVMALRDRLQANTPLSSGGGSVGTAVASRDVVEIKPQK